MTIPSKAQLKEDFERDGFVVMRNYLSEDEVEEMRQRLAQYHSQAKPEQVKFGAIKTLAVDEPWYRNYLLKGRHIPLMKHLIDDRLSPDNVSWIAKPRDAIRTLPHFDALGSYRVPPSGISLWIALDRIDLQNGCLHYEKGSHRKTHPETYPLPDYDETNPNIVAIEADPGDAVIHSAKTVHFSHDPLDYDRARNAMVFVYWGASSEIATDKARAYKRDGEMYDVAL